ncbi:MAG TPA: MnmC family methyltransferase [Spirochaetota bacterium]|nr:MnmC family methyltransferase [Spirochaetota bacterium]
MSHLRRIITGDNSFSVYNSIYEEGCHSLTGAVTEAREKFVRPFYLYLQSLPPVLSVLDICFGLGNNSFSFLNYFYNKVRQINITAYEIDTDLLRFLPENKKFYPRWKGVIDCLAGRRSFKEKGLSLKLLHRDFTADLLNTSAAGKYHFIMHDPFSPLKCPEQWTAELFKKYYTLLRQGGMVTTYASAKPVRAGMLAAGFAVRSVPNQASRKEGTMAVKDNNFATDHEITDFYNKTTARIPFRQPPGCSSDIIKRRRCIITAWEREKKQLVEERGFLTIKRYLKNS